MKENGIQYEFKATPWQYSAPGGWHFVSMPESLSTEIRENFKWQEEGWGRLKATAKIKDLAWETAIWFDTKLNTYILPLKADVRKKLDLKPGIEIKVTVSV